MVFSTSFRNNIYSKICWNISSKLFPRIGMSNSKRATKRFYPRKNIDDEWSDIFNLTYITLMRVNIIRKVNVRFLKIKKPSARHHFRKLATILSASSKYLRIAIYLNFFVYLPSRIFEKIFNSIPESVVRLRFYVHQMTKELVDVHQFYRWLGIRVFYEVWKSKIKLNWQVLSCTEYLIYIW